MSLLPGPKGPPKGVMLTHTNLVSNIVQSVQLRKTEFFKPNFQPSSICILPMFHMFGLAVTSLLTLHVGGRITTLPKFDPQIFLKTLERTKPSFLHFTPPLLQFCAYNPKVIPEHLDSLKYVVIAAAPVGQVLAKTFKEKAPQCQCYEGTLDLNYQKILL